MHELVLVCLLLFYSILLRKFLNWSYKCTIWVHFWIMFYSCPVPSKELICAVAFCLGIWVILERGVSTLRFCTYIRNQRFLIPQFWSELQELWVSALPRIQEGVFRIIPLFLSLCPEHRYDAQLLELPFYSACKLFLSSYFSKRRNKFLTSATKTPCSGFCPPLWPTSHSIKYFYMGRNPFWK